MIAWVQSYSDEVMEYSTLILQLKSESALLELVSTVF
jgi:hypothetical protein